MKPFLLGKKCHDEPSLRPPPSRLAGAAVPCTHAEDASLPARAGAQVEVVKEGGKVVRLIVTCGCGERVEVECLYSPGS